MENIPPPHDVTPAPTPPESGPAQTPESTSSAPLPLVSAGPSTRNPLAAAGIWMIVLAAMLLLCGLCSAMFYVVLPLTSRNASSQVQGNVIFGSAAGFGLLCGLLFVWQGIIAWQGRPSVPSARAFPPLFAFVLAFLGAVLLGMAALSIPFVAPYGFPPLHLLAAALPPLALLTYAAQRLGRVSGFRALLVSFGWGALAATSLAFIIEMIVALALVVIAAVVLANAPNSRALLDQLQAQLRLAQRTQDLTVFAQWLASPVATAALIAYFALIIPPIEEAVKALVVAFADPRRTRAGDALLWGISAGAGFAVLESMFNASVGLDAWAFLIVLRAGSSVLHVANGATMGLGWYAARVEKRWGRLVLAYLASVVFHAFWNGTAIFLSNNLVGPESISMTVPGMLGVALLLILFLLACIGLVWIVYAVRTTGAVTMTTAAERRE